MSDPRAVLDEIRDRVDRMVTPDGKHSPPDRYLTDAERRADNWDCIANIAGDLTRLAAALRVVATLSTSPASIPARPSARSPKRWGDA